MVNDTWDWAFVVYTGINWLGYTEKEVWQLTPLKWHTLINMHIKLFNQKWGGDAASHATAPQPKTGFIDQLRW
nr:MAG TPA: tail assembly chaperone protein [Caudoviricetes sp.]